jgi:hypothetical protein
VSSFPRPAIRGRITSFARRPRQPGTLEAEQTSPRPNPSARHRTSLDPPAEHCKSPPQTGRPADVDLPVDGVWERSAIGVGDDW